MPPRGVKKGTKRARQYEHVKESQKDQGASESRAEEIAARTVNKEKARSRRVTAGLQDLDPGQVAGSAGRRALGHGGPKGRTKDQLYNEAKQKNIDGRSSMTKSQLQKAVDGKKS